MNEPYADQDTEAIRQIKQWSSDETCRLNERMQALESFLRDFIAEEPFDTDGCRAAIFATPWQDRAEELLAERPSADGNDK